MLQEYYEKFPQHKIQDAFKLCDTCNHNAGWLNLNFHDNCEGCHYEILEKDGLYFVAPIHIDHMDDLSNHNTPEECSKVKSGVLSQKDRDSGKGAFGGDSRPTIVFYKEVGK